MYLFRNSGADPMAELSPEEKQAHMEKWGAWMGTLGERGILEGGEPLNGEGKRVVGSDKVVSDGPYAEGKEVVGGYLIVNAASIDEAVEVSKQCPIFENDGQIEVREIMDMNV
jgi:hypothetical protein